MRKEFTEAKEGWFWDVNSKDGVLMNLRFGGCYGDLPKKSSRYQFRVANTNKGVHHPYVPYECFSLKDPRDLFDGELKLPELKPKSMEELGEELCDHCPLPDEAKGSYSTPSGNSAGCEGSHCSEAYDNYLESLAEDEEPATTTPEKEWVRPIGYYCVIMDDGYRGMSHYAPNNGWQMCNGIRVEESVFKSIGGRVPDAFWGEE